MAFIIQKMTLPVIVDNGATCASACFLLFAAGQTKFATSSSHIGVHSVVDTRDGQESVGARSTTTDMARLCAALGVPPSIVGLMVSTRADDISWLSKAQLIAMGVKMVPD